MFKQRNACHRFKLLRADPMRGQCLGMWFRASAAAHRGFFRFLVREASSSQSLNCCIIGPCLTTWCKAPLLA